LISIGGFSAISGPRSMQPLKARHVINASSPRRTRNVAPFDVPRWRESEVHLACQSTKRRKSVEDCGRADRDRQSPCHADMSFLPVGRHVARRKEVLVGSVRLVAEGPGLDTAVGMNYSRPPSLRCR